MNAARRTRAIGTILIVALSGFLLGFDGSLFTGAVVSSSASSRWADLELGWTVSSHPVAATLSIFLCRAARRPLRPAHGPAAGYLRFHRGRTAGGRCRENFATLIVARLLSGLGVGAVLVAAPMYIAEISPPACARPHGDLQPAVHRARASCWPPPATYFIIRLESFAVTGWIADLHLADWNWRWMLGIGALPAIAYFFALLFVPESPRWLAMHGRLRRGAPHAGARSPARASPSSELAEVRPRWRTKPRTSDAASARPVGAAAARRAGHRAGRRHPAADHRHQLGARLRHR